jgi:hypothetical protein
MLVRSPQAASNRQQRAPDQLALLAASASFSFAFLDSNEQAPAKRRPPNPVANEQASYGEEGNR